MIHGQIYVYNFAPCCECFSVQQLTRNTFIVQLENLFCTSTSSIEASSCKEMLIMTRSGHTKITMMSSCGRLHRSIDHTIGALKEKIEDNNMLLQI